MDRLICAAQPATQREAHAVLTPEETESPLQTAKSETFVHVRIGNSKKLCDPDTDEEIDDTLETDIPPSMVVLGKSLSSSFALDPATNHLPANWCEIGPGYMPEVCHMFESLPFPLEDVGYGNGELDEPTKDGGATDWTAQGQCRWQPSTYADGRSYGSSFTTTRPLIHKIHTVKGLRSWSKTSFVDLFDDDLEVDVGIARCLQLLVDRDLIRQSPDGTKWQMHPALTLNGSENLNRFCNNAEMHQSKRCPNPLREAKDTLHVLLIREAHGPDSVDRPSYVELLRLAASLDGWIF
jgi:hypothetical protein